MKCRVPQRKTSYQKSYLSDTSTDTRQDGKSLLVDVVAEDILVKNCVLFVGCKLGGTLGCLDHDRGNDTTIESAEPDFLCDNRVL